MHVNMSVGVQQLWMGSVPRDRHPTRLQLTTPARCVAIRSFGAFTPLQTVSAALVCSQSVCTGVTSLHGCRSSCA